MARRDASRDLRIRGKRVPPSLPDAVANRAFAAIRELAAAAAERARPHVRHFQKSAFVDVTLPRVAILAEAEHTMAAIGELAEGVERHLGAMCLRWASLTLIAITPTPPAAPSPPSSRACRSLR